MKTINRIFACFLSLHLFVSTSHAYEANHRQVTWGGFIDGQYAFDFNAPSTGDRAFTTQPARANEFNLNLGYFEVNANSEKTRGRFAIQAGTSVQANYSSEPRSGSVSGPDLSQHIQEARMGYRVSEKTWVDAGIFFAHVGSESWISKDNFSLTRSLVADYSPYYLSGMKLTHEPLEDLRLQLIVSNGWQIISENNTDKNIGTSIEFALNRFSIAYNAMMGNEISPDLNGSARKSKLRHFHNFIIRSRNHDKIEWIAQLDVGYQQKQSNTKFSQWIGSSLMARYRLDSERSFSVRFETFKDTDQIVLVTSRQEGFTGFGGSIGFNQDLDANLLWRSELRYLGADAAVFPKSADAFSKDNLTATMSLALTI